MIASVSRVLDDPLTWAAGVALVALWCMGQALVGEPGLPVDSLPPARYVVLAPVVTGASVLSEGPPTGLLATFPSSLEPVAPVAFVDGGAP